MSITKREITAQCGVHKIINEMWGCSVCNQESNSVEWNWSGKSVAEGYLTTNHCPKCQWRHQELK